MNEMLWLPLCQNRAMDYRVPTPHPRLLVAQFHWRYCTIAPIILDLRTRADILQLPLLVGSARYYLCDVSPSAMQ